jgi:hypothetical protein
MRGGNKKWSGVSLFHALLQGRWESLSHVSSSNWSIYSLTGKSLLHDVQRTVTVRQPIRRNASPPHIVHFIKNP